MPGANRRRCLADKKSGIEPLRRLQLKISFCTGRMKFWKVDLLVKKVYKKREYSGDN